MADKKPNYDLGEFYKTGGKPSRHVSKKEPMDEATDFLKHESNPKTNTLAGQPMKQKSKHQLPAVSNPDGKNNR